ncbi:hypothetical protein DVA86_31415 [Streptomyces armeniacus]|uniref:Uncharacterized protein n=1 Tax=Streptomyces armeniacus TaxID=83291 RepID=A0A345XXQ9_9ACTN|nr:hypothetical protein DVA86_31415 [Streptomyces armeniacus]
MQSEPLQGDGVGSGCVGLGAGAVGAGGASGGSGAGSARAETTPAVRTSTTTAHSTQPSRCQRTGRRCAGPRGGAEDGRCRGRAPARLEASGPGRSQEGKRGAGAISWPPRCP